MKENVWRALVSERKTYIYIYYIYIFVNIYNNKGKRLTRCVMLNISSLLELIITNCDLI